MKLTSPFVLLGVMAGAVAIAAAVSMSNSGSSGPPDDDHTLRRPQLVAPDDDESVPVESAHPIVASPAGVGAVPIEDGPPTPQVDPRITEAESIVRDLLKDPLSAQFRRSVLYNGARGTTVVCGEVNGKNGFGGYMGFQPYSVIFSPGQPPASWIDKPGEALASSTCDALSQE